MHKRIKLSDIFKLILILIGLVLTGESAYALSPSFYRNSSVLSGGKWVKIEIEETGIQFISDETLKQLGFGEPEKVNIFGYGGIVIPEDLNSPDDLPLIPSLRVGDGIYFFGSGFIGWEINSKGGTQFSHISNHYSDKSYYFLSDSFIEREEPKIKISNNSSDEVITEFTERLVHEEELMMPINTGRLVLGEDFKTSSSRSFRFNLPGINGNAKITTSFGCKTSSGISTLVFSANGKQLGATTADRMAASDSKLIVTTKTIKEIENPGENLDFSIKFNGSGNVNVAGLDYIEIEYPRLLDVGSGELYFYVNPSQNSEIQISGGNSDVKVLEVTNPLLPELIETELKDGLISFNVPPGYHEFVAFDPTRKIRNITKGENVPNQDIHSLPSPEMLVISPPEFIRAAQRLAYLHRDTDGLKVLVLTPEEIYNEFSSGKPDVSAFRKLLKMWYDRAEGKEDSYSRLCLIMSRPTYDNKIVTSQVRNCGYPRVPIWQSPSGETESASYSTDDYIGMLKDVEGSFNISNAEINVAVGRMPFKSLREANEMIDKLENYLFDPSAGSWKNNIMVIADDQDKGVHLEQAEAVIAAMRKEGKGNDMVYEKLYLDSYPLEFTGTGASYPQAHERMMSRWNEGTVLINYIGHANSKSWGHEGLLTWTDINSIKNSRLPFIYAATCDFMRWDGDDVSGAEALWLNPTSGVIGMICPSREVIISANGTLNHATAKYVFQKDPAGKALTVGEIMRRGKNDSNTGTNKLRYGLIGDPSLRLPFPSLSAKVDELNEADVDREDDFPVLKARGKANISGHIEDLDGNPVNDFNGLIEVTLFDSEKAITTNGNGADGVESVYNDRKTKLFKGKAKVINGSWTINFTMPSEIENNFSPALLSLYAYEDGGRDANGNCEKLYVYGIEDNAPEDFEGPKMIEFYLNHADFVNGSEVSPNPVLVAKFYDESGISVSEAGIGHNMTLLLDGKSLEDVSQFYEPDEEDSNQGSLIYSLSDAGYGKHNLQLTVWDNANNSTTATLDFSISALWKPTIEILTTDFNPATSNVNFIIGTDGSTSMMECRIEVYDLMGRRVWRENAPSLTSGSLKTTLNWDLCDNGGGRVPGGLYLYKATIKTENGIEVSKTNKLLVR